VTVKRREIHAGRRFVWPLAILLAGVLTGISAAVGLALFDDLPQIRELESFRPAAVTRVYSADRHLLTELYAEKRDPVPITAVPAALIDALLATEDRSFYSHGGIDLRGVLRAIWHDIRHMGFVEGASTITQQLAKTLFLSPEKSISRKIKEAFLAIQLERRYTKDEILEFYLNQIYLGSGAYGVAAAARVYFNKSLAELDLAECALLAGLPKAPSYYNPFASLERARRRRDLVLHQMRVTARVTEKALADALARPILLDPPPRPDSKAPWFVAYIKHKLDTLFEEGLLYRAGLTVETTLLLELQHYAQTAVEKGIHAIEQRTALPGNPGSPVQGALVAIDRSSGAILCMTGGRRGTFPGFNRAVDARRQPGSAFKPIVYALAVEQGLPQSLLLLDAPVVYPGAREGESWRPQNFSKRFSGKMTLRRALAKSVNIPAIRLLEMLGPAAVSRFAHNLGITAPLVPNLSLALGTSGVSLQELTGAYNAFSNRGRWVAPFAIVRVVDHRGREIYRHRPSQRLVMSRESAAIMTDMLQAVVLEGTAKSAAGLPVVTAGKTGTTNDNIDAWFVGFSPQITAGVWIGRDAYHPIGDGETGGRAALPVWVDFMRMASRNSPHHYFDHPPNVVRLPMDPVTGRLQPDGSRSAVRALFRKGAGPVR
jgi:penicillin-binding protein 1A